MRITRRSLALAVLPLVTVAPAASLPRPAVLARQSTPATIDLVRLGWADVGVPTPFRVSTAGPGGPVLLTLLYDTLTWKDEEGIIPWLATAWTV